MAKKGIMPNRIYCERCKRFLVKMQTGYTVRLSENMAVRGDRYICEGGCDTVVYGDFGEPFESVESSLREIDTVMRKAGRRLVQK